MFMEARARNLVRSFEGEVEGNRSLLQAFAPRGWKLGQLVPLRLMAVRPNLPSASFGVGISNDWRANSSAFGSALPSLLALLNIVNRMRS